MIEWVLTPRANCQMHARFPCPWRCGEKALFLVFFSVEGVSIENNSSDSCKVMTRRSFDVFLDASCP